MRSCVVTGAAMGIGKAIALKLVAEGIHVVAVDWNRNALEELEETVTELGGSLEPLHADVSDWETHVRAAEAAATAAPLRYWVNNAGIDIAGGAHEVTPEEIGRGLGVLQLGPMYGTATAVRHMGPERAGSIVNISSIQGIVAFPRYFTYQAAKAAVIMITKSVAVDYGPFGIRCNAVLPGTVETPMTYATLPPELPREEGLRIEGELAPLGRVGRPAGGDRRSRALPSLRCLLVRHRGKPRRRRRGDGTLLLLSGSRRDRPRGRRIATSSRSDVTSVHRTAMGILISDQTFADDAGILPVLHRRADVELAYGSVLEKIA